jgi:hypothetical protein
VCQSQLLGRRVVIDGPQQPELYRNGETGTVPPDNRPGYHPDQEQDQPDRDLVARRLGVTSRGRTKQQLYDEARRRRIRSRSKMTKAELERAIEHSPT